MRHKRLNSSQLNGTILMVIKLQGSSLTQIRLRLDSS